MQTEPLVTWSRPVLELVGFIAQLLAAGAIGFRFVVLRGARAEPGPALHTAMSRRAAALGLAGVIVSALLMAWQLPGQAARQHTTAAGLLTGNLLPAVQALTFLAAIAGFTLAAAERGAGWPLAATGVVVGALRGALLGQWSRLVNPVHVLAAGFWIGTLFVMVTAGLAEALRGTTAPERRGPVAAALVRAFSPLALASAGVLALFGVVTAWRHLGHLAALWTTPYGWTLVAKLCVVAAVVAAGAFNWRRQGPALGNEAAAVSVRRSATTELVLAGVVLVITAVLVSLPSPIEAARRASRAAGASRPAPDRPATDRPGPPDASTR